MRGLSVVVGLLALVSSCGFNPHPKDGKLPCDKGCPSGYACGAGNLCWLNGTLAAVSGVDGALVAKDGATVEFGGGDLASGRDSFASETSGGGAGAGGSADASNGGRSGDSSVDAPLGTGGTGGTITGGTITGGTAVIGGTTKTGGTTVIGGTTVTGGTAVIGGATKTGGTTVVGGTTTASGGTTTGGGSAAGATGGAAGAGTTGGNTAAGGTSSAGGTITVTCPAGTSYPACTTDAGVVAGNACAPNPLMFAFDANCNIGLWASDGISNGYFYQPWCNNLTTTCTLTMTCATNSMHIAGSYLGYSVAPPMDGNAGWGANLQVNSSDAGLGCQMIDGTRLAGLTLDVNVTTIPAGNHLYIGINLANGNSAYYMAVLTAGAQTVRIPWACFKNEKACGSIPGPGITDFYYTFDWFNDAATHAVDITLSNIGFY
jgi:hypothetical protein